MSIRESLRSTEVLRRTGKEGDLQAFANRAASARAVPTVSGGAMPDNKNPRFAGISFL
jgi:hypothetical protein